MVRSVAFMLRPSRTARSRDGNTAAVVTGLAIAWGGTALLVSPAARVFGDPARLSTALIGQALF
jgi:hypothetical protein